MIVRIDLKNFIPHVSSLGSFIKTKEIVYLGLNYSIEGIIDHLITVGDTTKITENMLVLSKKLSGSETEKIISRWFDAIGFYGVKDVVIIIDRFVYFLDEIMNAFKHNSINPCTIFLIPGPDSDLETLYKSTESFLKIYSISKTFIPIDLTLLNFYTSNILDFGKKINSETILKKIIPLYSMQTGDNVKDKIIAISYLCNVSADLFNTPENVFRFFKYTFLVNFSPETVILSSTFHSKKIWETNELEKTMIKTLKPLYQNSLRFSVYENNNLNNELILYNVISKISSKYCYLINGYIKYSKLTNLKPLDIVITQNIIEGCKYD